MRCRFRALRASAPDDAFVFVALENQPDLAAALVAAGAMQHMEAVFMRCSL